MPTWGVASSLELSFSDVGELRAEYEAHLRRGRAFVASAELLPVLEDCQLVIHVVGHPSLHLSARVVMPTDQQRAMGGVGISLHPGFEALFSGLLQSDDAVESPSEPEASLASAAESAADGKESAAGDEEGEPEPVAPAVRAASPRAQSPDVVDSPVTRLSRMTMPEKLKLIRKSKILSERNMLERMLGKAGWDALLQNPRLTIPEVAKLAQKGTVPKPMLERIVDNKAWVAAAPVRRALLRNPKLPRKAIADVLRSVPRRELELMVKGAAYPPAVRDVIRRMLGVQR